MPDQMPQSPLQNPNAESDYVATQQSRQDNSDAMGFVRQVETASPEDRKQILGNNDLTEESYAQTKQNFQAKLGILQKQQETTAEGAGQHAESLDTAVQVLDPIAKTLLLAGSIGVPAAQLTSLGIPAAAALARGVVSTGLANLGAEGARALGEKLWGKGHPIADVLASLAGGAAGGSAGLAGASAGAVPEAGGDLAAEGAGVSQGVSRTVGGNENVQQVSGSEGSGEAATVQGVPQGEHASVAGNAEAVSGEGQRPSSPSAQEPLSPEAEANVNQLSGEHNAAQFAAQAKAAPMTSEEIGAINLSGAGFHALPETPLGPMDTLRLHYGAANQVADFMDSFRATREAGDSNALAQVEEMRQNIAGTVIPRWQAALHQAGFTLRMLQEPDPATQQMRDVFEAIRQSPDDMDRMIKALGSMPTVAERAELLKRAGQTEWSVPGAMYNLYVNSILSLNSAGKKAVSDAGNIIWQPVTTGVSELGSRGYEAARGLPWGSTGTQPGSFNAMVRGMNDSFGRSVLYGLRSFDENKPVFSSGDVGFIDRPLPQSLMAGSGWENSVPGKAIDFLGHMISVPGRSILGVDQFAKSIQYDMEMSVLAHEQGMTQAANEGLSGLDQIARAGLYANGYVRNPTDSMLSQAMSVAKTNTFTADLEGSLAKADGLRTANYALRSLVPFMKTKLNITLQGIRQSPMALGSPRFWQDATSGGRAGAVTMTKAALGSTLMGYVMYHTLQGRVIGGVPENLSPENRREWLQENQPYSIKAGIDEDGKQRFLPFNALGEPLSWLLGVHADSAPAYAYLDGAHADEAAGIVGAALTRELDREPMWGAIHTMMQAMDDDEKGRTGKVTEFGARMLSGFIPSTLSNWQDEKDPIKRQVLGPLSVIVNRIPWLRSSSHGGLPTLDPYGDEMHTRVGFMWNEFHDFYIARLKPDPVLEEDLRLRDAVGFTPPKIPQAVPGPSPADADNPNQPTEQTYGAAISPEDQNRWMKLRGEAFKYNGRSYPSTKDAMLELQNSPEYKAASDSAQADMRGGIWVARQTAAEGRLYKEKPDLPERIKKAYQAKGQAFAPRSSVNGAGSMGGP